MSYLIHYDDAGIKPQGLELPFKIKFNFQKVITFWEELAEDMEDPELAALAKPILNKLESVPELRQSFVDPNLLVKHQEVVTKLLYPIFPRITTHNEIKTAGIPFMPIWFNASERFKTILKKAGGPKAINMRFGNMDMMYINACVFILNFKYGANINFKQAIFYDIPDATSGILRHYRVHFNADFFSFTAKDDFVPPTKEDIRQLIDNFEDIALWKEKMPPESHTLEGFGIIKLFDVTMEEAISSMKYNLLNKDALLSSDTIEKIRLNLSSMLDIPNIKLGVVGYDEEMGVLTPMGKGFWNSISLVDNEKRKSAEIFCDMSHDHLLKNKTPLSISVITPEMETHSQFIRKLVKQKLKSYVAIPLLYNDKIIGVLEVGSEKEGEISSVTAKMLEEVTPLFTTALQRSQDEFETKLEAIIQEKCTAIHPAVSWRFLEAAANLLENQRLTGNNDMEEIVFPEVYPLYGQSDINGSSTERNAAIQADMIEQLIAANEVLRQAIQHQALPIYKKMAFRIDSYIKHIKKGLGAGDEIKVLDFLKREIYPTFKHLRENDTTLAQAVETYNQLLDEELEVVYKKRKDYETSVTAINETMSDYIEVAQQSAQQMFPHYFEKYQTDGVEHDMYIGQSVVKNKTFHPMHLHNLRLWQLMVICEGENKVYRLKDELPVPLRVASLILIHSNAITIKFRSEEKRFDVDGAYNVRYEIIKKRIDKALIKGTTERLTQVGKIAIVYSQETEAQDYIGYLEYLQSINYIGQEIERLDLEEMQGVSGMKALRVSVVFHEEKQQVMQRSKALMEKVKA